MKISEADIKNAIVHPEAEIRLLATTYFADSYSPDPTVMTRVIEAVEKHGRPEGFRILRRAERLVQTPATIDWLMGELGRDYDTAKIEQDNYRFAAALILCQADPELLINRHRQIVELPAFPELLKGPLSERMKMYFGDWPSLWANLEALGREVLNANQFTLVHARRMGRIIEALARHRKEGGDTVLSLLHRKYKGHDKSLMQWLEPQLVELAGRMRLAEAIPLLLERLDEDDDAVLDEIASALIRIGGQAAVDAVIRRWPSADTESRFILAEVLEHIHNDQALAHLLRASCEGEDFELVVSIAHSALGHLSPAAIAPVRKLLLEDSEDEYVPEQWDLRYGLVAVATLLGETFPEYQGWHDEAMANDYGWRRIKHLKPLRLADAFAEASAAPRPEDAAPAAVYQLKITLKGVKPPIWRRLLVPDCTLDDLHRIIQLAMGWESYHLYAFNIHGMDFTHPAMDEGELNMEDSTGTRLGDVIGKPKQKFAYRYDFGDCWDHEILVEKIVTSEPGQTYPLCVKGSRACPPEDVGGAWGYAGYLQAMADPKHDRHKEFMGWRGPFDPAAFDPEAVNRRLREVFP